MLTYMWTRIFCSGATLISFLIAAISYYCGYEFLFNMMLGIFGSSFLAWIGALIAYKVTRREAIMEYLSSLRTYRRKFRQLNIRPESVDIQQKQNLRDCFDEWFMVYSKIQHICKPLCKYRKIPKALNKSLQLIIYVQGEINCSHTEYELYSEKIDDAIRTVEILAKDMKYLHSIKEKNSNG